MLNADWSTALQREPIRYVLSAHCPIIFICNFPFSTAMIRMTKGSQPVAPPLARREVKHHNRCTLNTEPTRHGEIAMVRCIDVNHWHFGLQARGDVNIFY